MTFPGLHRPPASPGPAQRWEDSDGDTCGPGEGWSGASRQVPASQPDPRNPIGGRCDEKIFSQTPGLFFNIKTPLRWSEGQSLCVSP